MLTTQQENRYYYLKEKCKSAWLDFATSILEIREKRLYLVEYSTFEDFCKEALNIHDRTARKLMLSATVLQNLSTGPIGPVPNSESQARPLAKLEPEVQRQTWAEIIEENEPEKITAKIIAEKVETKKEFNEVVKEVKRDNQPNTIFVSTPLTETEILKRAKEINKKKKEDKIILFENKKAEFNKEIKPTINNRILYNGDCLQFIETLKDNSIDLFLADPPYAMNFKSGWSNHNKIKNDTKKETLHILDKTLYKAIPKTKIDSHFYIFSNIRYISEIQPIIERYIKIKNILIWDRGVIGMGDLSSYGFSYDVIFFGHKKNGVFKPLNGIRDRDILKYNRVLPQAEGHPTPKPTDLIEYIIKKSSNEFDNILDPFLGGGSTIKAAIKTNRNILGAEIDIEYFNKYIKKYM